MMSVPAEYVPFLVISAFAVAIIFFGIILLGDWKEAQAKKKAEKEQQRFQVPQTMSEETSWPPVPKP